MSSEPIEGPEVELATEAIGELNEVKAIGDRLHRLAEEEGWSDRQLGLAAGGATAALALREADEVLWSQLAILKRVLLCDFLEVCRAQRLAELCAGFLRGRARALRTVDPERALKVLLYQWMPSNPNSTAVDDEEAEDALDKQQR